MDSSSNSSRAERKPLLILDLNGTLLLSQHQAVSGKKADAKARAKFLYFRPHMRDFLTFAFAHFYVAVWSSNSDTNTSATVQQILHHCLFSPPLQFAFVWGRSYCTLPSGDGGGADYSSIKDLGRLYHTFPRVDPRRVTIVDDTVEKISGALYAHNYLRIEPYDAPNENDECLLAARKRLCTIYSIKET